MRARGAAAAIAGLAAVAAAGCGSARERDAPPPAVADAAVAIDAPADGQRLQAAPTRSGVLRARVRARGHARPGGTVFVSAGCRPRPCRAQARSGADGRWSVTLTLTVPRALRFVTIDAGARPELTGGAAVATVELVARPSPQAKRGSRARATNASSDAAARAPRATAARARRALPRDVLVVGDSLTVGMAPTLRSALRGWQLRIDGRIGRPLDEGMRILRAQASSPPILAFSLFTNDDPRNLRALEAAVRATGAREQGCAVWATIVAPPFAGVGFGAANRLLRDLASDPELARGLELVDWAALVERSPALLSSDAVHASPQGYRVMGRAYAAAIRACAGER